LLLCVMSLCVGVVGVAVGAVVGCDAVVYVVDGVVVVVVVVVVVGVCVVVVVVDIGIVVVVVVLCCGGEGLIVTFFEIY